MFSYVDEDGGVVEVLRKAPEARAPAHAIKEAWTESTFFIDFIATSTSCLCLTTLRASSDCPWIDVLYLGLI
jgi:hypothetical protein